MHRRCGIAFIAAGILLLAPRPGGALAQEPSGSEARRAGDGALVVEPGHESALERNRARREALGRQRRGEVSPVRPRRGITVGPPAAGVAPAGTVAAGSAPSLRTAGLARIDPRGARPDRFSGRIFRDPFYLGPFHNYPFGSFFPGPGWGTACLTFIPGRPLPGYAGNISPYGNPFAFFGFCDPRGFSGGFGSPFVVPHRFHQRFYPDAAAPWPSPGFPLGAPLESGVADGAAPACFLLAIVDGDGRRYSGAIWLPAVAAEGTDAVELAVEAGLARGGALSLLGLDGSWIHVRPSLPLESILSEPCTSGVG